MSRYREWDLSCKVYVGNLGSSASKHEIESAFSKYGPLRNVWVARNPPGFAFVEFEDPRDAEDAVRGLDGTRMCGTRVRVEMSSGRSRRGGGGGGGGGRRGSAPTRYSRSRSPRRRSHSRSRSRSRSPRRSRSDSRDRRSLSHSRSRSLSRGKKYTKDLPQRLLNRLHTHKHSKAADVSFGEGIVDRIISRNKLVISVEDNSTVYIKLASISSNNAPYSWEAKQALYQMLADRKVYFVYLREVHPGKLLADVYLPTGESATEMLIMYGLASVQHCRYVPKKVLKYLKQIQHKAETKKRGIWGLDHKMLSPEKLHIPSILSEQIKCVVRYVQSINNIHVVIVPHNFHIQVTIPGSRNVLNAKKLKMIVTKYLLNKEIEMKLHSYDISTNRFSGRIIKPHLPQLFYILWKNRKRKRKHHMYYAEGIGRTSKSQQKKRKKPFRKNLKHNTKKYIEKPGIKLQPVLKDVNDNFWQNGKLNIPVHKNRKSKAIENKNKVSGKLNVVHKNGKCKAAEQQNKPMYATVVEVLNGNSFTLKVRNQVIKNVFLSYVKFPWDCSDMRNLCWERIQNLKLVSMYYTHEHRLNTRELLRKLLLGNTVRIVVDYLDTSSKRIYCTISVLKVNIGEMLIKEGLAYYAPETMSCYKLEDKFLASGRRDGNHRFEPSNLNVNVAYCISNALQLWPILETEGEVMVVVEQVLSPSYIILFSEELGWLFAFSLIDFEEIRQANTGISNSSWKDTVTKLIANMCLQYEVTLHVTALDRNGVFHGDLIRKGWNLKQLLLNNLKKRNYDTNARVIFDIRSYKVISKRKIKIPVEEINGYSLRPKSAIFSLWMKRKQIKRHRRYITSLHPVVAAHKPTSSQDAAAVQRLKQCLRRNVKTMTTNALSSLEDAPHYIFNNNKRGKNYRRKQRKRSLWYLRRKQNQSERRKRRI